MIPPISYFVLQLLNLIRLVSLDVVHDLVAERDGIHVIEILQVIVAATEVAAIEDVVVTVVLALSMIRQNEENLHQVNRLLVGIAAGQIMATVNVIPGDYSKSFKEGTNTTPRSVSRRKSTNTFSPHTGHSCVSIYHIGAASKLSWAVTKS